MAQRAIQAYRSLLRQVRVLEPAPLRRKLLYNARALWEAHRGESDPALLAALHEEAAAAERAARWLRGLPKASGPRPRPAGVRSPDTGAPLVLLKTRLTIPQACPTVKPPPPTTACRQRLQEHAEPLLRHFRPGRE